MSQTAAKNRQSYPVENIRKDAKGLVYLPDVKLCGLLALGGEEREEEGALRSHVATLPVRTGPGHVRVPPTYTPCNRNNLQKPCSDPSR